MAAPLNLNSADDAVAFATDTSGLYPHLCDHFVGLAYGKAHSGYESAWVHWNQTPSKLRHSRDLNAPVGSLVFWTNSVGDGAGHAAIVTGKDKNGNAIVTSTHANGGRPTEFLLKDVMPGAYAGWATPYFQGETAKLDTAALNTAVVEVGANPTQYATGVTENGQQDTLNMDDAVALQGYDMAFVKAHPQLAAAFQKGVDEGWFISGEKGKALFQNELAKTSWWRNNSSYARDWALVAAKGGEDAAEQQRMAGELVRQTALKMGVKLSDKQTQFFAKQTLINGWHKDGRQSFLAQALAGDLSYTDDAGKTHSFTTDHIDYTAGGPTAVINALKATAQKNGVQFSEDWYKSAAKAVVSGLGSIDDYTADIRQHAASAFPVYADKINAGMDVADVASPYLNKMAQFLELNPETVSLNDAAIKKALGGVDDKGNPKAMGLWEFEKSLKQDSRWQYTKNAHDEVAGIAAKLVSMFGFGA